MQYAALLWSSKTVLLQYTAKASPAGPCSWFVAVIETALMPTEKVAPNVCPAPVQIPVWSELTNTPLTYVSAALSAMM
jgi:hypothetical protein